MTYPNPTDHPVSKELGKAIREFRKFCFEYRDKMYADQAVQPTSPILEAQNELERAIQSSLARERVEAQIDQLTNLSGVMGQYKGDGIFDKKLFDLIHTQRNLLRASLKAQLNTLEGDKPNE